MQLRAVRTGLLRAALVRRRGDRAFAELKHVAQTRLLPKEMLPRP